MSATYKIAGRHTGDLYYKELKVDQTIQMKSLFSKNELKSILPVAFTPHIVAAQAEVAKVFSN